MFTYQVRPRILRHEAGETFSLPANVEIRFHFRPLQPFGMEAGGGHTAVRAVAAKALLNANTGEHTVQSETPLEPLDVTIQEPIRIISQKGNILSIKQHFNDLSTLHETIQGLYFTLPMLLNVEFADPPFIERVDGVVGKSTFRWELSDWRMEFRTTTQENQESAIIRSWKHLSALSDQNRRRLLAALHYFHVACRLSRSGTTPGEFLSEVLLNLAKTLEVLFPPTGDGHTRDAARAGLKSLGYMDDKIDADYIPAMALRNEIDVGHVELGVFKLDQLKVLHAYTERAENAFRDLLNTLLEKVETEEFELVSYKLGPPRSEALEIIERLRQSTPQDAV